MMPGGFEGRAGSPRRVQLDDSSAGPVVARPDAERAERRRRQQAPGFCWQNAEPRPAPPLVDVPPPEPDVFDPPPLGLEPPDGEPPPLLPEPLLLEPLLPEFVELLLPEFPDPLLPLFPEPLLPVLPVLPELVELVEVEDFEVVELAAATVAPDPFGTVNAGAAFVSAVAVPLPPQAARPAAIAPPAIRAALS
jgi:hypothetical protein